MSSEAMEVLRTLPIFNRLSEDALSSVASRTVVKRYPKDKILFRQGEEARGLFVVVAGGVKIYQAGPDGREQTLYVERPGHSLAEIPLFDGSPYPASARASEESRILFLPRDAFEWLYRNNPDIADATIRELGRRLRRLVRLVDRLSLKSVPARVAATLLEAAAAAGCARDGGELVLQSTQEEMAAELGTTRESVSRALSALRSENVIRVTGQKVLILDFEALRETAGVPLTVVTSLLLDRTDPFDNDPTR
ncbi:MAG: hypothetical protein AMXMBFR53_08590 [Gemmatimonadota bacterium]